MPDVDLLDNSAVNRQVLDLIQSAPLPGLGELPKCEKIAIAIDRLIGSTPSISRSLQAGLWLLAGELDRSHTISQNLTSIDGSYWHAMMHRREGDYWNSKYWYRKAKGHPVFAELTKTIGQNKGQLPAFLFSPGKEPRWSEPSTVAEALVDHVEMAVAKHEDWQLPLQRVCWWEWQLLFLHCCKAS